MRRIALCLAALLVLPACDTGGGTEPPPDELDPIGVIVRYRASTTGDTSEIVVIYTEADGDPITVAVDFSRTTSFEHEILLPPGTEGTFEVSAEGFITDGNLVVSIGSFRADDEEQIAFDTETASATGTQEIRATVPLEVTVVTERPPETTL